MNILKDEITSPLSAQLLEFSESELFPETIQNSEVGSSSNCCYEDNSSYSTNHLPLTPDMNTFNGGADTKDDVAAVSQPSNPADDHNNNNHMSIIFDAQEDIDNDFSASIDFGPNGGGAESFSLPPHFLHHQFDISSLDAAHQIPVATDADQHQQYPSDQQMVQLMGPPPPAAQPAQQPQPIVYDDECLSSVPSYLRLTSSSPSCSLLDPSLGSYLSPGSLNPALSADNSGVFTGAGFFLGADLPPQDLEFQGDNSRLFCPDSIPRVYNCASDQFQTLSSESQHLVSGAGSSTPLTSDITCLEDTTFKVGKLSVEERKEKIHRYLKKRNERNFSKKIKYACRKTLADSRPRVRGRFAKNDDFGDVTVARAAMGNHEDDTAVDEAARHNFLYDPNNYPPNAAAAALTHGGRIFNSNCLAAPPGAGPYDMCTTLFCADANMH
ncbi:uncharacterized protein LOC116017307 isoform X3 [Ipomoea triloba]|uniref:uncharacterized protein LOC116017307 isoform X3 n=1 Tax=Ipomoea triloba TaxID=35885 RepID=UPI00125D5ADD|nr:uncharacterized protein LOC116017307 isoform X3 [Ipomoea triloba]